MDLVGSTDGGAWTGGGDCYPQIRWFNNTDVGSPGGKGYLINIDWKFEGAPLYSGTSDAWITRSLLD